MYPAALIAVGAAAGMLVGDVALPYLGTPWLAAATILAGAGAWLLWRLMGSTERHAPPAVEAFDGARPPGKVAHQLQLARRHDRRLSLILFRLAGPNAAVPAFGGAPIMSPVSSILTQSARKTDFVLIGTGGREIALVCPETETERARMLGQRLREQVARQTGVVTTVGVAGFPDHAFTFADLLDQARGHLGRGRAETEPGAQAIPAGAD